MADRILELQRYVDGSRILDNTLTLSPPALVAALASVSSVQASISISGGESIPLAASISSLSSFAGNITLDIRLIGNLTSRSTLTSFLAGTGSIGAGDRVEIRRLSNTFKITKV